MEINNYYDKGKGLDAKEVTDALAEVLEALAEQIEEKNKKG